jgi:hypothetical protein
MSERNKNNYIIQKQLRKKICKKEKILEETVINKRNIELNSHHENFITLGNEIFSYRKEYDTMKIENFNINEKDILIKQNNTRNEELSTQRDETYKLIHQIEQLKQTINTLKDETDNMDNIRKKLVLISYRNYIKRCYNIIFITLLIITQAIIMFVLLIIVENS